jgi:peptide/nickel transport system substrate-binding protein
VDPKNDWKKFRTLKLNTKTLNRRLKKAETASTKHAHRFVLKRLTSIRDAKRHILSWLLLTGALIVATAIQLMWFQNSYQTTATVAGGTYSEGVVGSIATLNPLYAQSQPEQSATRLIFSSLYDYDETGHLRMDLAKKMTVDDTGKKYTVELRSDVKWHDGQSLTADDVVYTVELMKNPAVRSPLMASWASVNVKKIDTNKVEFTIPSSFASFPHLLNFSVLPKHTIESIEVSGLRENSFSSAPIGSGPFKLRLLQTIGSDEATKVAYLSRWDDYYRGQTKLDRFEIHTYASPADVKKAYNGRDINAAIDANTDDRPGSIQRSHPLQGGVYALLNTTTGPLSDIKVRQALQRGASTSEVRSKLSHTARAFDLPVSSQQVETAELPKVAPYNETEADALLTSAGWIKDPATKLRTKNGQKLVLRVTWAKNDDYSKAVDVLAEDWKKLGIETQKIEFDGDKSDQSFAQAVLQPRAYDVLINELTIGSDADVFPYWHSSQAGLGGFNFSNYKSSISDDALLSARLRSEQQLRDQKYKVFTEEWVKDVPAIGLYQSALVYTQSARIKSFNDSAVMPTAVDRYANVIDWTTESAQVYKTP